MSLGPQPNLSSSAEVLLKHPHTCPEVCLPSILKLTVSTNYHLCSQILASPSILIRYASQHVYVLLGLVIHARNPSCLGGCTSLSGLYNRTPSTEGKGAGERGTGYGEGKERWQERREEESPVTLGTPYGPENPCMLSSSGFAHSFLGPSPAFPSSIQVTLSTLERLGTNLSLKFQRPKSSRLFTTRKRRSEKDMKGTVSLPLSLVPNSHFSILCRSQVRAACLGSPCTGRTGDSGSLVPLHLHSLAWVLLD